MYTIKFTARRPQGPVGMSHPARLAVGLGAARPGTNPGDAQHGNTFRSIRQEIQEVNR